MAITARDLKNDATTDTGFDLAMDPITALSADVGITKLMIGASGDNDGLISSATPLPVDLGTNNDVTLATLPDTSAGDLAAINAALAGTLTVGSHAVTNAGTFAVQVDGDALTALQLIDDAVYTDATGTPSKGLAVMGTDGTNPQIVSVDTSGHVQVDVLSVTGTVTVDGSAVTQPVSASSLPLPSGAATAANQSTANTSLGNVDTNTTDLPNVIGTDGAAGPSKAVSVAGTESDGTLQEVRVDTDGHLQVDVLSGASGSTQYAVDDAGGATDTGTLALAVRDDALSALTPIDGDYTQLRTDANGALWVIPSGTVTVDASGTAVPITDNGGSLTIDNAALSQTGGGAEASALRVTIANDSTGVVSVDDGGGTLSIDDGGGAITVDGTVSVTSAAALDVSAATVTVDSELPAAAALADNAANPTAPAVGAFGMVWDGATWDRLPGTAADGLTVNLGTNNDVTVSGTVTVDASGTAVPVTDNGGSLTVDNATLSVTGGGAEASALRVTLANDSTGVVTVDDGGGSLTVDSSDLSTLAGAVSGNEVQVDVLTMPTTTVSATQLDVDDLAPTADGVSAALDTSQVMDGTTSLTPKYAVIDAASSGDNTLVAAVAGKKIRVLSAFMVAAGAVNARFEDGAGGTALTGQMNLTTNSGFVLPFNPVGWFETSANTLLNLELSGATSVDGSLVYVEV